MPWYEWFFSGIGTSIISLLRHGRSGSTNKPNRPASKPSPDQINKDIRNAAPFLRDQLEASFRGLEVAWLFEFLGANKVTLAFTEEEKYYWVITGRIYDAKDPSLIVQFQLSAPTPALQTAHKQQLLLVRGRITDANGSTFRLDENPEIEFVD